MIIKIVQDFYEDIRFKLMTENGQVVLADGDELEFLSEVKVNADGAEATTLIQKRFAARDNVGRVVLGLDTAELKIVPGRYHWELNLIRPDSPKINLLERKYNELIIMKKEADGND